MILKGLKKELEADFYVASVRPAAVYRGNPFQIEVGIAYGKPGGVGLEMTETGRIRKSKSKTVSTEDLVGAADEPARVLRYANRVPLLYQQSGCAITNTGWPCTGTRATSRHPRRSTTSTSWRPTAGRKARSPAMAHPSRCGIL